MPRVQAYQRQVSTEAAPIVRRQGYQTPQLQTPIQRATPSAESFGAGFGEAAAHLGEQLFAQEVQKQDDIRVTQAERKLSDWELQTIYDPQKGALNVRGEAAFALPDKISQDFTTYTGDIRNSLSNDRQRMAFDRIANARHDSIMGRISSHVAQQAQQLDDAETKAYVQNEASLAQSNAYDPASVSQSIDNIHRQLGQYAARQGWGPETTKSAIDSAVSNVHVGVIDRMLSDGQDIHAKVYFEAAKGEIEGDKLGPIEKALEVGTLRGESQRTADSIISKIAPDSKLSDVLEKVDAIKDPELRDSVEQRVRSRYAVLQDEQRQQAQLNAAAAKDAIDQAILNATNIVERSKSVDAVPPALWLTFTEGQRSALRSYAKQIAEKGTVETDWSTYYGLMRQAAEDPQAFAKTNLLGYISKLDPKSEFKQLAELQASILKGNRTEVDKVLDGVRSNVRIINGTLLQAGIDPADKKNGARVDQLWRAVDEQVQKLQRNTGKKVEDPDLQKIVDGQLMELVTEKGSWWNIIPGGDSFTDVKKRAFEITTQDIPAAERSQIETTLRAKGRPVTDEAIRQLYIDTQERLQKKRP